MIKPQKSPYEFKCLECGTTINLPRKLEFELPNGDEKCLIVRPTGNSGCPNCGVRYKFKKVWDYGTIMVRVYKDGDIGPCFVKTYKKATVK